jgi:hypothetical protein
MIFLACPCLAFVKLPSVHATRSLDQASQALTDILDLSKASRCSAELSKSKHGHRCQPAMQFRLSLLRDTTISQEGSRLYAQYARISSCTTSHRHIRCDRSTPHPPDASGNVVGKGDDRVPSVAALTFFCWRPWECPKSVSSQEVQTLRAAKL